MSFSGLTDYISAAEAPLLPIVSGVEAQPLRAQVRRLLAAMEELGAPLPEQGRQALQTALNDTSPDELGEVVQQRLDPYCLLAVNITPESRVKVAMGPAQPELMEQEWRDR